MLEGAVHIGKNTIVEEFAKTQYEDYLILDFTNESKGVKDILIPSEEYRLNMIVATERCPLK